MFEATHVLLNRTRPPMLQLCPILFAYMAQNRNHTKGARRCPVNQLTTNTRKMYLISFVRRNVDTNAMEPAVTRLALDPLPSTPVQTGTLLTL